VDVSPRLLRQFVAQLEESGHNPGGVFSIYRSVRTFLLWCEDEYEPPGWKSPTRKVKVGRGDPEASEPLSLEDFAALVATCKRRTFNGERDRAILYTLLDTGIRRQELADLHSEDFNPATGSILIRSGKGGKSRTVFLGATSRRAVMQYQRLRADMPSPALWLSSSGAPLRNDALRSLIRRRAIEAGVTPPGLHAFRRAFAINFLRNGGDVLTLQRLLGHSTLAIINRYVKFATADIAAAHAAHGVVDRL
jgi:site-specific recombinase XerD